MRGVIAAGSSETANAGLEMLAQGGNAVDAAVAAKFASFICEIGVVHWGGSGIANIYDPVAGHSTVYDFFSNMPGLGAEARRSELDFRRVTVDFGATKQNFWIGRGSVAVPGNIFGLCQMAADHGRLPLTTLLQPALKLARDGYLLNDFQAATCQLLYSIYSATEPMRRVFLRGDRMIGSGERLYIPDLATTLEQLAAEGAVLLRSGALAKRLVADQAANGGLLTERDLTQYTVKQMRAIRLPYRDHVVLLPPPSSIGGMLIGFTLKLLSEVDVQRWPPGSAEGNQLIYEALQITHLARRRLERAAINNGMASLIDEFFSEAFVKPYRAALREAIKNPAHRPAKERPGHNNTSHLSVMDGEGMAVSITTTAGESAGYFVPNSGFIPNNMLGEADLNPHGWHRWPAGARISTMCTPTILLRDGKVRLVTGSGGSERIRSAIVQVISNFVDHGLPLQQAVDQPRIHVENGIMQCELGYREDAVAQLERWHYRVNRWRHPSMYFGGTHSVGLDDDGNLTGAGDWRRDGSVGLR